MIRSAGLLFLLVLPLSFVVPALAQSVTPGPVRTERESERVRVYFRNNTPLPRNITIVTYPPGTTKGKIDQTFLFPFQRFSREYPTDTKIYLASPLQVEQVVAGSEINDTPAAMTIRRSDEDEVYMLFRR